MLYSYKWLQELSHTKKSPQEIAEALIVHSFEVEDVVSQADGLGDVVIGHVLAVGAHPDADRLRVVTVDVGEEKLQIVCGAPNVAEGQKVAVALVGAVLPGDFTIKKSKIRGVESVGMICAEDELGLGNDHDGIMVLDADAPVGDMLASYMGLDDTILDVDVLPNRGHDALSHRGMAREIAALEGRVLAFDDVISNHAGAGSVEIATPQCSLYTLTELTDVDIAPSPTWLQRRLKALGHNSINNVVDITNYVMLETGQPIHAFDAQYAGQILVRQAEDDEKLTLLDDSEIVLTPDDVVITDGQKPIALAGVMGGQASAISEDTSAIALEVAHFAARSIRATKVRHGLQTDAAYRFERDIDPNLADEALSVAVRLFADITDATIGETTGLYPAEQRVESWSIALEHNHISRLLGVEIDSGTIHKILESLEIVIKQKSDVYLCHIPTRRRDLRTPEDLIEEIGRIYGFEHIHAKPLVEHVAPPVRNEERYFERTSKDLFSAKGFSEVRSYSFYSGQMAQGLSLDDMPHVVLAGGGDDHTLTHMRRTLAPGLLQAAAKNQSFVDRSALFEIGRLYKPVHNALPAELLTLGAIVTSKEGGGEQFYELKGMVEQYMQMIGLADVQCVPVAESDTYHLAHFHPARRCAVTLSDGTVVGVIGEISKKSAKAYAIKNARCAYGELDLGVVRSHAAHDMSFQSLQKFPSVMRDLSVIVSSTTLVADVEREIYASGGQHLADVDLFDLYTDDTTGERSVAFHLIFQSADATLSAQEIDPAIASITAALSAQDYRVKGL